jgi:hypothetical protein
MNRRVNVFRPIRQDSPCVPDIALAARGRAAFDSAATVDPVLVSHWHLLSRIDESRRMN